jgi:hypothetical protein
MISFVDMDVSKNLCVSGLTAVTELCYNIVNSFEYNQSTLAVFLDLSKAFDTINHDILLKKLEWYGVRGRALEWFRSYLSNRTQFVLYNLTKSSTHTIPCGVPQGSVLGPLLFIIYTNDLPNCLTYSKAILFADDTTIYLNKENTLDMFDYVNSDLGALSEWFRANKLSLNVGKTNYVVFKENTKSIAEYQQIKIGKDIIERKSVVKFLGAYIDSGLEWHDHLKYIKNKLNSSLYALRKVKNLLNTDLLLILYYSLVHPYIEYGISYWGSTHSTHVNTIFIIQKKAVRIVKGTKYNDHTNPLFKQFKIMKLQDLYRTHVAKYMYNLSKGALPIPLMNIIKYNACIHTHNTRNKNNPHVTHRRTNIASKSLRHKGPEIWYQIPEYIQSNKTVKSFASQLKKHIIDSY